MPLIPERKRLGNMDDFFSMTQQLCPACKKLLGEHLLATQEVDTTYGSGAVTVRAEMFCP